MDEKPDDDEIHYYIESLNTVIASQGISSYPETPPNTLINSRSKSILQNAKHKKVYSSLSHQLKLLKTYLAIYMEVL